MNRGWTTVGSRGRGRASISPRAKNERRQSPKTKDNNDVTIIGDTKKNKKVEENSGIKSVSKYPIDQDKTHNRNTKKIDAAESYVDEKKNGKIVSETYELGTGDKWVGNPSEEDNFVEWALIDNAHANNPMWNNVTQIERRIMELDQISKFVKSKGNKNAIQTIMEKWQLRLKTVILTEGQLKRSNDNMDLIIIDDDEDHNTNKPRNLQGQKSTNGNIKHSNYAQVNIKTNDTPKSNNIGQDNNEQNNGNCEIGSRVTQSQVSDDSEQGETMAERLKRNMKNQTMLPHVDTVRVRISFTCKTDVTIKRNRMAEYRRVLIRALEIANKFDKDVKLLPWKIEGRPVIAPIHINELYPMKDEQLREYLNIKNEDNNMAVNKLCHGFGINFKTKDKVSTFIDKWNSVKFDLRREIRSKGWIGAKRAEVQKYHNAIPIGFFQGSSENGVYDVLNEELSHHIGAQVEMSFQNIYQRGVTGQFWEVAKKEAHKQGEEGTREFRRRKFSLAPSGLIVYVYRESDIKKALDMLVKLYSKETAEKAWPLLPDGSRMKFIPMVIGPVIGTRVKKQLTKRINWHITAKALEEVMDLPLIDIFTKHEYFSGNSLAYILQGVMSNEIKGATIFRHVTKKWTINPENREYEITAHYHMRNEANHFMKNIETFLKDNYGEQSLRHVKKMKDNKMDYKEVVNDNDAVSYILGLDEKDNNEGILEEGFKLIVGEKHEAKPQDDSTIHISDASKDTLDSDESMRSRVSLSSYSMTSKSSAGSQVQWSPSVKDNQDKKKRKIGTAMKDLEMSDNDLEKWKADNPEVMQTLRLLHKDEYKIFKAIVKIIQNRRAQKAKKQKKDDNVAGSEKPDCNT